MYQLFSLAGNSHARHPLHQFEGMVAAKGMDEDHMQARHLRPGATEVVEIQNDMISIDPSLHQDHDLLFVLGHTPLDLGRRPYAEEATQTRDITGAEAPATAAMVTAVEVAVQIELEVVIDINHRILCNLMTCVMLQF